MQPPDATALTPNTHLNRPSSPWNGNYAQLCKLSVQTSLSWTWSSLVCSEKMCRSPAWLSWQWHSSIWNVSSWSPFQKVQF